MVECVVTYVPDTNDFKAAPLSPEDVVAYRAKNSALLDLCPSLQFPKPAALAEVPDQVNKAELREEICHFLDPRASSVFKIYIRIPEDNGVHALEAL